MKRRIKYVRRLRPDESRDHVYLKLTGGTFSARRLDVKDPLIRINGDTAWAEFYRDFTATLRQTGQQIKTAGRETQIYRRERGAWRIVHVHYSAMPAAPPGS